MKCARQFRGIAAAIITAATLWGAVLYGFAHRSPITLSVPAQAMSASSVELETTLFVQTLERRNGEDAIVVLWIPQPIQKLCLGKTEEQCAAIDYCIRTTNQDVARCRNLGIPISRLPSYPPEMRPRRQLSVVYFATAPTKGFATLQEFYHRAPKASLQRLSMNSRIKARIRFTRKPDDDDFDLLEVLAVAPF